MANFNKCLINNKYNIQFEIESVMRPQCPKERIFILFDKFECKIVYPSLYKQEGGRVSLQELDKLASEVYYRVRFQRNAEDEVCSYEI